MRFIIKLSGLVVILFLSQVTRAQVASPYEVDNWAGNRNCAISYTFDDGCSGQFSKAIPIFNEFDYKLTLFTVTDWVGGNWNNWVQAANSGHEIASHTVTHPDLSKLDVAAQESEIKTSTDLINEKVPSQQCVTMATPYCAEGSDSLAAAYYIAVRGCQGFIEPKTPKNFMNVSSIICGDQGSVKTSANFKSKADQAANSKGWLVYLIHGIDNDGGYSPLPSDTLKKSLEYLKANDDKFWVATFGQVSRYIKERNCASLTETASDETSFTLTLSDTLSNNEIFNYPLTLRRPLPDGWENATATQNGDSIFCKVVSDNSGKWIQFDAVPDQGSIVITKALGTGIKDTGMKSRDFKIWIHNNDLKFELPETCDENPSVSIYNVLGERIFDGNDVIAFAGICTLSPMPLRQSGIYILKLADNQNSWAKQFFYF